MQLKILDGANMDIDLTSSENTSWKQMECPRNEAEKTNTHKCAVKNISICPYFCGIEYLDNILCCYPHKNTSIDNETKKILIAIHTYIITAGNIIRISRGCPNKMADMMTRFFCLLGVYPAERDSNGKKGVKGSGERIAP